jgi:hypothetical protein
VAGPEPPTASQIMPSAKSIRGAVGSKPRVGGEASRQDADRAIGGDFADLTVPPSGYRPLATGDAAGDASGDASDSE